MFFYIVLFNKNFQKESEKVSAKLKHYPPFWARPVKTGLFVVKYENHNIFVELNKNALHLIGCRNIVQFLYEDFKRMGFNSEIIFSLF